MAFVLANRVKETTATTGTGTLSLAGAVADFQGFVAGVGDGNACYYCIELPEGDEWEVGIGEVTDAATDTLSRDTVLASSNADALVNFSAGSKNVFVTYPAGRAIYRDADGVTWIGDGTNYMEVRADGEISLKGTARVVVDIEKALGSVQRVSVKPDEGSEDVFRTYDFDDGSEESIYFSVHTPTDYAAGTDMELHLDYFVDSVDAGTQRAVRWGLEYKVIQHGDVFDFDSGTVTVGETIEIPTDTADKEVMTCDCLPVASGDLPGEGELLCRLHRDVDHADDDHDGDARLFDLHVQYTADKMGGAT